VQRRANCRGPRHGQHSRGRPQPGFAREFVLEIEFVSFVQSEQSERVINKKNKQKKTKKNMEIAMRKSNLSIEPEILWGNILREKRDRREERRRRESYNTIAGTVLVCSIIVVVG
jgi:hypothetical protein